MEHCLRTVEHPRCMTLALTCRLSLLHELCINPLTQWPRSFSAPCTCNSTAQCNSHWQPDIADQTSMKLVPLLSLWAFIQQYTSVNDFQLKRHVLFGKWQRGIVSLSLFCYIKVVSKVACCSWRSMADILLFNVFIWFTNYSLRFINFTDALITTSIPYVAVILI